MVLTTKKESPVNCDKILLHEDILEHHPTVIRGIMIQKFKLDFEEENLILGIDPGQRMGLSIFYYGIEIESSVHNSIEELIGEVKRILGNE